MNEIEDDSGDTALALFVLLIAGVAMFILALVIPAPGEEVCLSKREARHLWPRSHIFWYSSDHCWSNRRGGPPRHLKIEKEPEPKEKKIKTDPVFPPRAEELDAVNWHMARPFDEAQPLIPPLNLAAPDEDVWPDLSEFDLRFAGVPR